MATIVLSAVGAAAGASIGGGVLGLSSAVIGRAVGATVGQVIDRRIGVSLLGGSRAVETGRVDRFRLMGASEGAGVPEIHGRVRVGGQIIWASRFLETVSKTKTGSGKGGGGGGTTVTEYSYSVSLAIALGAGRIGRVGRIWADGAEVSPGSLNMRVYDGAEDQLPDPKIEAVEGAGLAPAYRGIAYVVIEDLELAAFGNRVPQFSFEVVRPHPDGLAFDSDLAGSVKAVAMIPGTGEYALATTPVRFQGDPGAESYSNLNSPSGETDFSTSFGALEGEAQALEAVSLVVSWFGNDLRCGTCAVRPLVEQTARDGVEMPWSVSGIARGAAGVVPQEDGRPIYGGTPADASVVEAIQAMNDAGKAVMFYPFLLMEQMDGNGLNDPWSDAEDQPVLPWRGRITLSEAPGRAGSPDGTAAAEAEVAAFFGAAQASDFTASGSSVSYTGPAENSYRRFILHYAHLCAAAGGVESFCIGSEMRSLTQVRGAGNVFPAVAALRALAADVRGILGPEVKIGYAADWSEYFGYHPQDGSGDVFFHLDPLWADPEIDFVGIDNYMPLSDWRDGEDHADAGWGAIYDLGYLRAGIEGGEGFQWYYNSPEGRAAQRRLPIEDGAYGEPWVWRYKDIRSWWGNAHHDRVGGVRSQASTGWVPGMKPVWFTELGCPAVDKGTNEPNRFVDPKSSESALPRYSTGARDDFIQMQYLRAQFGHWSDPGINPVSAIYGGPMVDMSRAFVWAWDARPFPHFPGNAALWSDGENYRLGHWLNGRLSGRALASVVAEICDRAGITDYDVSQLWGVVRGYAPNEATGRAALQPLMLAYGFDAIERDGVLIFRSRSGAVSGEVTAATLSESKEVQGAVERLRAPDADVAGRLRVVSVEAEGDYAIRAAEAILADEPTSGVVETDLPLVLTAGEGQAMAERWLAEARTGRESLRFSLPPSRADLGAGDIVRLESGERFRIDQVESAGERVVEAVRIEAAAYIGRDVEGGSSTTAPFAAPVPVHAEFLDLPLLTGTEIAHAPHIAVFADPWPGPVAVYSAGGSEAFTLNTLVERRSVMGVTETALAAAEPGAWDRGPALRVRLFGGALASVSTSEVLNGANAAAIGAAGSDHWEVFQFADATLIAPGTYDLAVRLRGQAGTDAMVPDAWPVGSRFVLLDGAAPQLALDLSSRGLSRTYRVGPASRGVDDPVYSESFRAFDGVGLRPYAPVHLRAMKDGAGDLRLSWIRCSRIDGDSWVGLDVPLGEDSESYLVRVFDGASLVREVTVSSPAWTYSVAARAADGVLGFYAIEVAQLSQSFGAGLFRRIEIDE